MTLLEGGIWLTVVLLVIAASIKTHHDWKTEINNQPVSTGNKAVALTANYIHDLVVFLFPFLLCIMIVSSIFNNNPPSIKVILGINLFMTVYYLQFAFSEMCSLTWIYNHMLNFPMDKPYRNIFRNNQSKMDRDYQSLSGSHYQNTLEWVNGNIITFSLVAVLNMVYIYRLL
jgi:hypothetical protein